MNRSRVEEQAGNDDAVHIRSCHGSRAADGTQRGKTEAQHYGVGAGDTNGSSKIVNTGREEQILAMRKLRIDAIRSVDACPRDIELADRDGITRWFRRPSR